MPATIEFESLSPEQQSSLTLDPQDLSPQFTSPRADVARALHARDLTKKALRHDDCRMYARRDHCANGHTTILISSCGLSICVDCAEREAEERILDEKSIIKLLTDLYPDRRLIFADLHLPCASDPDSVKSLLTSTTRTLLSCLRDDGAALSAYDSKRDTNLILYRFAAGFSSGNLILRFILIHDTPEPSRLAIKAAFPNAVRATVSLGYAPELSSLIKHFFTVSIPQSPDRAADMELAFTRVRRFLRMGELPSSPNAEIIVQETPLTNISASDSLAADEETPHKKCRRCSAAIVSSEFVRISDHPTLKHCH